MRYWPYNGLTQELERTVSGVESSVKVSQLDDEIHVV